MSNVAKLFLLTGAITLVIGMVWGIQMSATGDHLLSPAHGHLNLIGFVMMSVFGIYYHLTPAAAGRALARYHYYLHVVTVILIAPGIAMAINGATEALAIIGSFLALGSILVFTWMIYRFGIGANA